MQHVAVQLGQFRNLKVKLRLLLETKNSCSLLENLKKLAFLTLYDIITSDWGVKPKQYWYQYTYLDGMHPLIVATTGRPTQYLH